MGARREHPGVTFLILVFSEITPKVIGANHANRLACVVSYPLTGLLLGPVFRGVVQNLFVAGLLGLLRLRDAGDGTSQNLSTEELRTMVLESGAFIPPKHRSILVNLFELEDITVEDVMTPRNQIEAVDIAEPMEVIQGHLATCYHTRQPVFDGEMNAVIGVLHVRRLLAQSFENRLSVADIRELLTRPYFIPASTPVYSQPSSSRKTASASAWWWTNTANCSALVTLEDIIEELIGKFTTSARTPPSGCAGARTAA